MEAAYLMNEIAFLVGGIVYAYPHERRDGFWKRLLLSVIVYAGFIGAANLFPVDEIMWLQILARLIGFGYLIAFQYFCWKLSWTAALYSSIWSFMSWQLLYEIWQGIRSLKNGFIGTPYGNMVITLLIFLVGYLIAAFTIARWMPEGSPKKIGPRQLSTALLIFFNFEVLALNSGNLGADYGKWKTQYLSQLLLAVILYLQNELFKKSAMKQELEVINLLWQKEQEQYQLSKENIALINQKCHDLKHQIRAIRNSSKEEMEKYLDEMEGSIRIYEAMVKTGNEVLDTILTEKSLYCEERGITVSCVADGSQLDFINTVDLYAILGNALDNAIEAVEKFKHQEKRQIDVLIYRQQNFLVMNIINPMKENLVFEEELPVSTKGDRRYHGFGLRSIQYLVKKYDGYLNISEEDGCFSLKILIPIPSENKSI